MRFLLDQGIPRSTVKILLNENLHAEHVGQLGMAKATDLEILKAAVRKKAVVVTLDSDFHTLLALERMFCPSVIRIRIEGLKGKDVACIIKEVYGQAKSELMAGAAVSVTTSSIGTTSDIRIRIQQLPLL